MLDVELYGLEPGRHHMSNVWLWYLGTLVLVIGLVQVGMQAMADRYTYIPLIGLYIVVAWGLYDLLARWRYQNLNYPRFAIAHLNLNTSMRKTT